MRANDRRPHKRKSKLAQARDEIKILLEDQEHSYKVAREREDLIRELIAYIHRTMGR